ncbi:MAG: thiamine diphosphokinase [Eubacteriales bacterium]|nr:thiamine diphosphokinase [Eubacteriales bacterium]
MPDEEDLVIAADGGLKYLDKLGIIPDIVVGDFDSEDEDDGEALIRKMKEQSNSPDSCEKIKLLSVKDRSDSAEAILEGKSRGYKIFYLYGCTGGRLDHTLASIQDIAALSMDGMEGYIFDKNAALTVITDSSISFPAFYRGMVSVFSYTEECSKVRESGLKYIVAGKKLDNRFPLGLSNEFTGMEARISVGSGSLLIYFELPENE